MKPSITDAPISQLTAIAASLGMKPYSSDQLVRWLYKKGVASFDEMTNISAGFRSMLEEKYEIGRLKISKTITAKDGTLKFVFVLRDGCFIESVLIPSQIPPYPPLKKGGVFCTPPFAKGGRGDLRLTLCISTQVGCPVGCSFCRTGRMGFKRNLSQGEILGQIIEAQRLPLLCPPRAGKGEGTRITNIVFMGMGEPLANCDAVSSAIELMLDERAFNFSKRRITLSTSGLIPQLEFISKHFDIKIAISLNATTDEVRNRLMPINRRYGIADLMKFCRSYSKKSQNRITFEYVMIRDINDSADDMKRLVGLLNGVRAKVNLIPFNPFTDCGMAGPDQKTLKNWSDFLINRGIQTNIRVSRGQEIMAACGQLSA